MDEAAFMARVKEAFDVREGGETLRPDTPHEIIMRLGNSNYILTPHSDRYDASDSISRLDVSILQENLLAPVLGIEDPRRNKRITFIGGMDAAEQIRALTADGGVGFVLYPTSIQDLIAVADDRRIMPPKSTWFEPKLLSGLFIHKL